MNARWAALALLLVAAGAACQSRASDEAAQSSAQTSLDDTEWLLKAGRLLLNGRDLTSDELTEWSRLPKGEAIDRMMVDPAFGDVALRFNLYFLGQGGLELRGSPPYSVPSLVDYSVRLEAWPQALASAQSVVAGGSFFDLFSARPRFVNVGGPSRGLFLTADRLDEAVTLAARDPSAGCDAFRYWYRTCSGALLSVLPDGLPATWLETPTERYSKTVGCNTADGLYPAAYPPADVVAANMRTVGELILSLETRDAPRSVGEMVAVDIPDGLPPLRDPMKGLWYLPASTATSTNFQRKRAAWILKTYFCDDLTPASLPPPASSDGGTSDVHASSASCQGCHYRLDPIAGLFRTVGSHGLSAPNRIQFDDGVIFQGDTYKDYLAHWTGPDGKPAVGYFVLGPDSKPMRDRAWLDSFPTDLDGLWSFLPRSTAAQKCVTRRLSEFALGASTLVDRDWLAEISTDLVDGPQSGLAFKSVLKRLVLSRTFSAADPAPGVCYDLPTGASPDRPSCAIAQIVSNSCATCHSSPMGPGHLDFTHWTKDATGTWWWSHTNENGAPLDPAESRRRIDDRITTTDLTRRMPLLQAFPPDDLRTFHDWLEP